jgi:hypothetical protein
MKMRKRLKKRNLTKRNKQNRKLKKILRMMMKERDGKKSSQVIPL